MARPQAAISACLLGKRCRYDGSDNRDVKLLGKLEGYELIPFCPEDHCFGTPRPTMDLVETKQGVRALSNLTGADLSPPVERYAADFFDAHPEIELFIGKDRSPSCGVCSARLYDREKKLLRSDASGLMAAEAKRRGIECWDAEDFVAAHPAPPIRGS
ncbi:DUF523 domain-containing protein [Nitratifractor sp.]